MVVKIRFTDSEVDFFLVDLKKKKGVSLFYKKKKSTVLESGLFGLMKKKC